MRTRTFFLGLAVTAGGMLGCGDTFVDPFVRDQGSFSVYGVLVSEGFTSPQRVRVQVVRTLPDPPTDPDDPAAQLAADVSSIDLASGDSLAWHRREVVFEDGTVGSVFEQQFRPVPGRAYRVRVQRRTDGATAFAEVIIPPVPQSSREDPVIVEGVRASQRIAWDTGRLEEADVRYFVVDTSGRYVPFVLPYGIPEDGVFDLDFTRDAQRIRDRLTEMGYPIDEPLLFSRVEVSVLGTNETSWPDLPEGDGPAAQPGVFSNVTGGYGLVVAASRGSASWKPAREAVIAAGFTPNY